MSADRKPLIWSKEKFDAITSMTRKETVAGIVSSDGNFGIWKDREEYQLIHLLSGFRAFKYGKLKEAKDAAERVRDLLPWNEIKTREDLKNHPIEKVQATVAALKAA